MPQPKDPTSCTRTTRARPRPGDCRLLNTTPHLQSWRSAEGSRSSARPERGPCQDAPTCAEPGQEWPGAEPLQQTALSPLPPLPGAWAGPSDESLALQPLLSWVTLDHRLPLSVGLHWAILVRPTHWQSPPQGIQCFVHCSISSAPQCLVRNVYSINTHWGTYSPTSSSGNGETAAWPRSYRRRRAGAWQSS